MWEADNRIEQDTVLVIFAFLEMLRGAKQDPEALKYPPSQKAAEVVPIWVSKSTFSNPPSASLDEGPPNMAPPEASI